MEHIRPLSPFVLLDEFGLDFLSETDDTTAYSTFYRNPEETKWIALSSILFGIPGIIFFYKFFGKNHPFIKPIMVYSSLLIISSFFSAFYWVDPRKGWRRNIDLIISKITFTTACICAVFYVNYSPINTVALYSLFPMYVFTYTYSSYLIEKKDPQWIIYHVAFHILLAIGAISVLSGMEINK
jgi:hypothetical protein